MTRDKARRDWLRIRLYARDSIAENDDEPDVWPFIRAFCKWWFDFLRSVLVVVAFVYFGKVSGNELIQFTAQFSVGMIGIYICSYFTSWYIDFFPDGERFRFARFALVAAANIGILTGVVFFHLGVLEPMIDNLAKFRG